MTRRVPTRAGAIAVLAAATILAAAVLAGPALAQNRFMLGQRAFEAGRVGEAHAIWADLAAHGDAEGMFGIGLLHDLGRDGPQDPAAALAWYRAAGRLGLASAAFNAGVMYDSGRAGPRDATAAALWYARAAAHGDARAAYNLGQLYASGDGVPPNPALAAAWLDAAARAGLAAARNALPTRNPEPAVASALPPATLRAPMPTSPTAGDTVDAASRVRDVELVWTAPREPATTRFYAEVVAIGEHDSTPVFAGYATVSAQLVHLIGPGNFAWRVYAVDVAGHAYAQSAWQRFALAPGDAAPQAQHLARNSVN